MKRNILFTMILPAFLLVSAPVVNAQKGMMNKQGYNNTPPYAAVLGLTDDQKSKVNDLKINHQKEVLPLKNQMRELKAHYKTLISSDKPDMNAIDQNIDSQTKVINSLMKSQAEFRENFSSILTDKQKLMLEQRGHGFEMKKGKGHYGRFNGQRPGRAGNQGPNCMPGPFCPYN